MATPAGHAATRSEFQALAAHKLREAKALLDAGHFHGAYYLSGYAVEFGLKACICRRRMRQGNFPDKDFSKAVYTHDLEILVALADLKSKRDQWTTKQPQFGQRWAAVARWTEHTRYQLAVTETEAKTIVVAITAPKLGVLTWLKKYW